MYQCRKCSGLGFIDTIASAAGALFGGGSGGGGGGGAMPITVSPNISTQVSPQISPIFQQQFQPQNSAATAGTAQSLPNMPTFPGQAPNNSAIPGMPNIPMPAPAGPLQTDYSKYMPYALAGLGILAFVAIKKRGQK